MLVNNGTRQLKFFSNLIQENSEDSQVLSKHALNTHTLDTIVWRWLLPYGFRVSGTWV